jgi:hypothetical protein
LRSAATSTEARRSELVRRQPVHLEPSDITTPSQPNCDRSRTGSTRSADSGRARQGFGLPQVSHPERFKPAGSSARSRWDHTSSTTSAISRRSWRSSRKWEFRPIRLGKASR